MIPKAAVSCSIQNLSITKRRKNYLLKNLQEMCFGINHNSEISAFIDLQQYENLFEDYLHCDIDDDKDENYASNVVNIAFKWE